MKELASRSGSQILRTFLPQQTVDLRGGIYRVVEWSGAARLSVDQDTVRRRLLREFRPWELTGNDSGVAGDLRAGQSIQVVELDDARGVTVERYPEVWLCQVCRRVGKTRANKCRCGANRWGQLHFLGFHECGYSDAPWIRRCPTHDDVKLVSPRSAKAEDIRFVCPECNAEIMKGLGFKKCQCGNGNVHWNVHKARTVYTPRGTVLVNPPSQDQIRELETAGGPAKALEWVVEGMTAKSPQQMQGKPTREAFIKNQIAMGMSPEVAEKMAAFAAESGQLAEAAAGGLATLTEDKRLEAEHEATEIALALGGARLPSRSLATTPVSPILDARYANDYPLALDRAGLLEVDLVEQFPVLNVMFGYSRGGGEAGQTRLIPFRNPKGGYRLHGDLSETEALLFRLDPIRTARWLVRRGHSLPGWADGDAPGARAAILGSAAIPLPGDKPPNATVGTDLFTLIHTLAHRVLRQTAVFAGIDRDALSEYLVPLHLGFFIYAAARGDFVLGGLQALFETELDSLLDTTMDAEHRCPLDPGCARGGSACSACLHVGEPSCRAFNTYLDRRVLFGSAGYLRG